LEQLNNHTIICGFGRLGRNLVRELRLLGAPLAVIDLRNEAIQECHRQAIPAILGNAADEMMLAKAGIDRAKSLVAAAKSDAENVFIVLTARSINPHLKIISRCNIESSIPKLEKAGANNVLSPYAITGRRIAQMLIRPNVVSFLDGILEVGEHQMRIEEFIISEKSPLADLTLREAKLKVAVLAVDHPGKMVATHPNADTQLLPGTALIAMGVPEELEKLADMVEG
jgi:voltage-gated potassium channel